MVQYYNFVNILELNDKRFNLIRIKLKKTKHKL